MFTKSTTILFFVTPPISVRRESEEVREIFTPCGWAKYARTLDIHNHILFIDIRATKSINFSSNCRKMWACNIERAKIWYFLELIMSMSQQCIFLSIYNRRINPTHISISKFTNIRRNIIVFMLSEHSAASQWRDSLFLYFMALFIFTFFPKKIKRRIYLNMYYIWPH